MVMPIMVARKTEIDLPVLTREELLDRAVELNNERAESGEYDDCHVMDRQMLHLEDEDEVDCICTQYLLNYARTHIIPEDRRHITSLDAAMRMFDARALIEIGGDYVWLAEACALWICVWFSFENHEMEEAHQQELDDHRQWDSEQYGSDN